MNASSIFQQCSLSILLLFFICIFSMCDRPSPCEVQDIDCGPNGQCVISVDGETATCLCRAGFSGVNCQDTVPCETLDCANGSECVIDSLGKPRCICPEGFIGNECEIPDPCKILDCKNGTPCIVDENFNAKCDCGEAYEGIDCSKANPCFGIDCPENAECVNAICVCNPGYEDGAESCDTERRAKFLGEYKVTSFLEVDTFYVVNNDTFTTFRYPDPIIYSCNITPASVSKIHTIFIESFQGFDKPVEGTIRNSLQFQLFEQKDNQDRSLKGASIGKINTTTGDIAIDYRVTTITETDTSSIKYECVLEPM